MVPGIIRKIIANKCYDRIQSKQYLFESSVQTVLIREHCQRYHSKCDFEKFDGT